MAGRRAPSAAFARGQHFLRSARLAAELVREAAIGPDDLVVELGAGSGRLTLPLADRARRVVALELDERWATRLRARLADRPNVEVVAADAVTWAFPRERFRVVANVPFDRTTAILHRLLDDPRLPLQRADLIVEWGVALKRAARWPSTLLNVRWAASYEIVLVRRLPAALFEPKPRVDAGVLRIVRRAEPLVPHAEHERFCRMLARAFRGPTPAVRHALAGSLGQREVKRVARELGFEPAAQARDLDAHQWAALFCAVRRGRYGVARHEPL